MFRVFTWVLTAGICVGLTARPAAQPALLAGVVVDQRTGVPLPGVQVVVDGGRPGVLTDERGAFVIAVTPGRHVVEASLVGYTVTRERVEAGAAGPIEIRLAEGAGAFEE